MTPAKPNVAASVGARLLNQARRSGDDFQTLLTAYAFERLLYRLGSSELHDRLVLKGAMLLRLWSDRPYRATRDLDLLRRPKSCVYPTLLDFPAPEVLAYPREAVVAEKLEALVVLGDRNSRIKDFFDLHHLASGFARTGWQDLEHLAELCEREGQRVSPSQLAALFIERGLQSLKKAAGR